MWNIYLLRISLGCLTLFYSIASFGSSRIPTDTFHSRYEKSSDIVLGEVISIESAAERPSDLGEFPLKEVFKATLAIKKSWKGRKDGDLVFFYSYRNRSDNDLDVAKKRLFGVQKGRRYILFLRELDGKKIAQEFYGSTPLSSNGSLDSSLNYKALELLASGKGFEEAVRVFGPKETKAYLESLKK